MSSSFRNIIATSLIKSISTKNISRLPMIVDSIITSEFSGAKNIFKVRVNSVNSVLEFNGFKNCFQIKDIEMIRDIEMEEHSVKNHYTFSISKDDFIENILPKPDDSLASKDNHCKGTVIVEYSSPNIAKPFHMGHLRSTVIGQFVANIMSISHKVVRINYLGDWGTQFGLVQAGLENMSLDLENLKDNPLRVINDAYVLANKDNKLVGRAKEISFTLERESTSKEMEVWKKLRELTIKHLKETYLLLGIHFDEYTWESQYAKGFSSVLEQMKALNLTELVDEQLVVLSGEKRVPLMKSDGTSLYLSRDILAALDRFKRYKCVSMKYVIGKSQQDHVEAVRHVVSNLTGFDVIEHIKFGKVIGMSSRKGSSVFLSDILNKATQFMAEQQQKSPNTRNRSYETTQTLAISALIVYLLKQRRNKDFTFDWEVALQSKGDTGVKLQYTHSRLCSLQKNCGVDLPMVCSPHLITEPEALSLVALLARYDQILSRTESTLESSILVKYLLELCNKTSACLKKLPIKGQNEELAQQRLLLFYNVRQKLHSGMTVLGLKPLESM